MDQPGEKPCRIFDVRFVRGLMSPDIGYAVTDTSTIALEHELVPDYTPPGGDPEYFRKHHRQRTRRCRRTSQSS